MAKKQNSKPLLLEGKKIMIKMKHDNVFSNTVVESFLAEKPEKDRLGFITGMDEGGYFWAYFPAIDYECAIFRDEFDVKSHTSLQKK